METDHAAAKNQLYQLLGDLPVISDPPSAHLISTEETPHYVLEKITLDLNGSEPVPAILTKPKTGRAAYPVILYNHAHGNRYDIGKSELVSGNEFLGTPPYAEVLAEMNIAALAIDHWGFGERRGRTESELFKQMLWSGQVLWGMMVYDSLRAIEYLTTRDDIDSKRIGTLGLSMGATMAWWTAALEPRVRVCVDLCCMTDFQSLIARQWLDGHGIYYYVPRLLKYFTTSQINALIAPRPHLSLNGRYDRLTPPEGLEKIDAELKKVYAEIGAPDAWRMVVSDSGHFETAAMRSEVVSFLKKWL